MYRGSQYQVDSPINQGRKSSNFAKNKRTQRIYDEDEDDEQYQEDDDEESVLGFEDISKFDPENIDRRKQIELMARIDEEYEGEWGYSLIKALRGKTVGRRLRRKLFKYGCFQLFCGFALFVISIEESQNLANVSNFSSVIYGGASLMNLTWCVSFPTFAWSFATMTMVRYWASVVTNRKLLANIMRIYTMIGLGLFLMTLWCIIVLFLTYQTVNNWNKDAVTASMLPYYICTIIFMLPLLIVFCFYTLDVSYLTDEIEKGGIIAEQNPPADVKDLSDVTLIQSCIFVCGMPCILCIQLGDLCKAVKRVYDDNYRDEPFFQLPSYFKNKTTTAEETKDPANVPKRPRKRTIWWRMYRTCIRCCTGAKKPTVQPTTEVPQLALKELEKDREQEEREQREKVAREQEAERQKLALIEAEANAEFLRRQEEEEKERLRQLEERRLREEREAQEKKEAEDFANRWESVLAVNNFKSLWASLTTNGSFQCNLKAMPAMNQLTEHLKRQGFHVVFATNANASNLEIGICNVRPVGQEDWFIARFLVSNNSFSAVMKATKAELVPQFVKKFALAKVLKIDTAK